MNLIDLEVDEIKFIITFLKNHFIDEWNYHEIIEKTFVNKPSKSLKVLKVCEVYESNCTGCKTAFYYAFYHQQMNKETKFFCHRCFKGSLGLKKKINQVVMFDKDLWIDELTNLHTNLTV